MVVLVVAVTMAVLQYLVPELVPALERTPSGLEQGEYWRLVTPLLVQTRGLHQVLGNLVSLAVIGVIAEWTVGRWWWAALAAVGTAGGQLAAYRWDAWGGGASIAICGLAGGVLVAQLTRRTAPVRWATDVVLSYIVALAGWGLFGVVGAALAVIAATAGLWLLRQIDQARGYRMALAVTALGSIGLVTVRDLHGAAPTAAILMALVVILLRGALAAMKPPSVR
jgi:Rhomboid family